VLVVAGAAVANAARNTGREVPRVSDFNPPAAAPALTTPLQPVSHWEEMFLANWNDQFRTAEPLSRSSDSWDHYELSYEVDGNNAMFRATGNTKYLDRSLTYINNVVASARASESLRSSQYHDKYLGWTSNQEDGDEVPLYESYFWRYATTTLRVVKETPAVYDNPTYRAQYDKLVAFAETNIFEKWLTRGADDNIYRDATHIVSHWALIATNLLKVTAEPARRTSYQTVLDNIDKHLPNQPSSLHQQMIRNPVDGSAYFWTAEWGSTKRPGQDVSHGNGVIAYVVESAGLGGSWSATDMERFVALLNTVLAPKGNGFAGFVDGSGSDNGWISDGFVKLGRFSPQLQQKLEQYPVVNDQFVANMALNAKILS